ncbi:MAG: hypothetical protein ABMA02_02095 [Saprospiraceae bacterium]
MTLVDQIREMISAGETEKSLEELYKFVKENNADIIDNLVMLRSRMQSVERAVNVGTMSSQEATLEKAKINDAILKLLPQLTPEYLAEASKRKTAATPAYRPTHQEVPAQNNNKLYFIIGGAVFIIVLLVWAMSGGDSENSSDLAQETQQIAESETGSQGQPAATLLDELLAKTGTATWQATVDITNNGTLPSFVFQDDQTCSIYVDGETEGTGKVVENATDHVSIYYTLDGNGAFFHFYKTIVKVSIDITGEQETLYEGVWNN